MSHSVFGEILGNLQTMTPAEEKFVRQGVCPRCLPPEGRPRQMRMLGESGGLRSWQCERCNYVWMISTPTSK